MTASTNDESDGSPSHYISEDGDEDISGGFDSPSGQGQTPRNSIAAGKNGSKMENGWKKKVKTELCRFWLNGQACENSAKEQGCGFAHGQDELMKKKGLSR